jgi:hypothetical protein
MNPRPETGRLSTSTFVRRRAERGLLGPLSGLSVSAPGEWRRNLRTLRTLRAFFATPESAESPGEYSNSPEISLACRNHRGRVPRPGACEAHQPHQVHQHRLYVTPPRTGMCCGGRSQK